MRWCATSALVTVFSALAGCSGAVFTCIDDDACPGGACQADGYCSFPDDACGSGQRYGEHAPASVAGDCVGEPTAGGSSPDGSTVPTGDPSATSGGVDPTFTTGDSSAGPTPMTTAEVTSDPTEPTTMTDPTGPDSTGFTDCNVVEFEGDDGEWVPVINAGGVSISNGVAEFQVSGAEASALLVYSGDTVGRSFTFELLEAPNPEAPLTLGVVAQSRGGGAWQVAELTLGSMTVVQRFENTQDVISVVDGFGAGPLQIRLEVRDAEVRYGIVGGPDADGYESSMAVEAVPDAIAVGAYAAVDFVDGGTPRLERITICPL